MNKITANFTNQLRDAIQIGENTTFTIPSKTISSVLICGLGGSGIGGKIIDLFLLALNCQFQYFMKTIYLIRHAKSSWKQPFLMDLDRPLSKRGISDLDVMKSYFERKGWKPEFILSSPAKRAISTAQGLFAKLPFSLSDDLYFRGSESIVRRINKVEHSIDNLALVAHNPDVENLLSHVIKPVLEKVPTLFTARCYANVENWEQIRLSNLICEEWTSPKMLC